MSRLIEKMRDELFREGARANSIAVAQRMLKNGKYSYDDIVEVSGLTLEEVKSLDSKRSA